MATAWEFRWDPTHCPSHSSPPPCLPRRRCRGHPRRHVSPARALPPPTAPSLPNWVPAPLPQQSPPHPGEVRRRLCRCGRSSSAPIPGKPGTGSFENNWSCIRVRVRALRLRQDRVKWPGLAEGAKVRVLVPRSRREPRLRRETPSLALGAQHQADKRRDARTRRAR